MAERVCSPPLIMKAEPTNPHPELTSLPFPFPLAILYLFHRKVSLFGSSVRMFFKTDVVVGGSIRTFWFTKPQIIRNSFLLIDLKLGRQQIPYNWGIHVFRKKYCFAVVLLHLFRTSRSGHWFECVTSKKIDVCPQKVATGKKNSGILHNLRQW